ncbi:copper transporter [Yinghuangia seranimata]|uniref:copper transporter n=1 Tax=Yinghuangia seranimata TaxID=408067 RepID=UPI00248C5F7B|nr:copper transporter [Yinghuangia seranimata]MDI2131838.1 copper transporter [Yinghuangia seranimata]
MIDFRYHVVSIIAVFLALSVGLVLGSSFLSELASKDLDNRIKDLNRSAEGLRRDLTTARGENDQLKGYIEATKPQLVKDQLKGRSVVLVTLPGADSDITDETVKTLEESGATVTGTVAVKNAWTDAAKETVLLTAAGEQGQTGGTSGGQNGQNAQTPNDRASAALASAIVHRMTGAIGTVPPGGAAAGTPAGTPATGAPPVGGQPAGTPATPGGTPVAGTTAPTTPTTNPGADTSAALATLTRFKTAGLVDIKGNPEKGATLAVVIAPASPVEGNDPARVNNAYLGLSRALDTADDGTVMAGDPGSAQDGGTIAALRRDDRTAKAVSSVDNANTDEGQVSVDWALVVEVAEGKSGQYGVVGGTDGWVPKLPDTKTDAKSEKAEKTS